MQKGTLMTCEELGGKAVERIWRMLAVVPHKRTAVWIRTSAAKVIKAIAIRLLIGSSWIDSMPAPYLQVVARAELPSEVASRRCCLKSTLALQYAAFRSPEVKKMKPQNSSGRHSQVWRSYSTVISAPHVFLSDLSRLRIEWVCDATGWDLNLDP